MSGAFLTYLASTKAGGATPLAFLLGTLAMLCVGGTVAYFARSLSSAGIGSRKTSYQVGEKSLRMRGHSRGRRRLP